MLAAHHDQENLVHGHRSMAARGGTRQLPKTPGARFPKTPLKVPLNDENAPHVAGGKALASQSRAKTLGATSKKQALATPMGTKQRAPLGNKTTNAKARTGQTVGVKDMVKEIEKSQVKQTTIQKSKLKPVSVAPIKFDVRNDEPDSDDNEVEYCPPEPTNLPFDADDLPRGSLTFEGLKKENLLGGFYDLYHDPVDENGVRLRDKEFEERKERAMKEADERVLRAIDNTDWSVCDVPETKVVKKKAPVGAKAISKPGAALQRHGTIAMRDAASQLSMTSGPKEKKARAPLAPLSQNKKATSLLPAFKKSTKPLGPTKTGHDSALSENASRNTLGYNKGRSALSIVKSRGPMPRTTSGSSDHSDSTITPENAHLKQDTTNPASLAWPRPQFLDIFDVNEDSGDEDALPTAFDDEDFQLKLEE